MNPYDNPATTRTDLGCAHGGEPGDNQEWLRSLKAAPTSGPCAFCGIETSRAWATHTKQLRGRLWALMTRLMCQRCGTQMERLQLQVMVAKPDLAAHLRADYTARLATLGDKR